MALPVAEFDPFGGHTVMTRPARPDDLVAVGSMLARLSPASARLRFFSPPARPRLRLVQPLVDVDHVRHESLVALCGQTVIGLAEYLRAGEDAPEAEVAVVVEDGYQHHGVASFLFRALARLARQRGIEAFTAVVMSDNRAALALARSLSPDAEVVRDGTELRLRIPIVRVPASSPARSRSAV